MQGRVPGCEVLTTKPPESSGVLHLEEGGAGHWEGVGWLHRLGEHSCGRQHHFNPYGLNTLTTAELLKAREMVSRGQKKGKTQKPPDFLLPENALWDQNVPTCQEIQEFKLAPGGGGEKERKKRHAEVPQCITDGIKLKLMLIINVKIS